MTSKQEPEVERDAHGRLTKGTPNPGGLTASERQARDAIRQALSAPDMRELGLASYRRLLQADNPLITKDFFDRVAGKAKELVELSQDPDAPLSKLEFTHEDLAAMLLARIERQKAKLESAPPVK